MVESSRLVFKLLCEKLKSLNLTLKWILPHSSIFIIIKYSCSPMKNGRSGLNYTGALPMYSVIMVPEHSLH